MLSAFIKRGGNVKSPVDTGSACLPGQPPRAPAASVVQLARKMPQGQPSSAPPCSWHCLPFPRAEGSSCLPLNSTDEPPAVHQAPLTSCNARNLAPPTPRSTKHHCLHRAADGPGAGRVEQFSHGHTASQVEPGYKPRCAEPKASCPKPCVTGSVEAEAHGTPWGMHSAASHRTWGRGAWLPRPPAVRGGGRGEAGEPWRAQWSLDAVRRGCHLCHSPGLRLTVARWLPQFQASLPHSDIQRQEGTWGRGKGDKSLFLCCSRFTARPLSRGPSADRPPVCPACGGSRPGSRDKFSSCHVVHWGLDIKSSSFKDKNKGCRSFKNCGKIYVT
ncbi:uncharacterized protein LOC111732410 [Pteropus vampyrus]|uniref:Uncharacterized protein LOC111732410 n=1 Tax=Pteropus vampyrus TaxID=132908 RepID=A0A6P6BY48_PTEVA|nr:uncharacterized protein LOC111732410 [Pteropus vampyrus]